MRGDVSLRFDDDGGLRLLPAMTLKRASSTGEIEGYASTFGGPPDSYGDTIERGAFSRTLAEHRTAKTTPLMLWSHDAARPIGRWTELHEDHSGLFVRGRLNLETSGGRDAYAHVKAGDVSGLSIGFRPFPGGRTFNDDGSATLTSVKLYEISVVALPANPSARVAGVKQLHSKSELIEVLRGIGLSRAAAARIAGGGWPALSTEEHDDETLNAVRSLLSGSARKIGR